MDRFIQCSLTQRKSLNNRPCPRKSLSCYSYVSVTLLQTLFSSMSDQKNSTGVWDTGPHVGSTSKEDMADINRTLGPMIGIDLGTSNSCVSLWHTVKNRAKVIKNVSIQKRNTPSTVVFDGSDFDYCKVGLTPETTNLKVVSGCKILMGLQVSDLVGGSEGGDDLDATQQELAISRLNLPTDLSLDCHTGHVLIRCTTPFGAQKSFSPEAIAAEILCALKKCAEEYLKRRPIKDANNGGIYSSLTGPRYLSVVRGGAVKIGDGKSNLLGDKPQALVKKKEEGKEKEVEGEGSDGWDGVIRRVVIGVPANCSEKKKEATRRAARSAGFEEIHLMVESTAAAMAYGLLVVGTKTVLVFDMGGGTTDVTIMLIKEGKYEVQASWGSSSCGGMHLDSLLLSCVLRKMRLKGMGIGAKPCTSVSEAKAAGENNDKDKDKDEVFPLTLESLVGPLKSQLLLLCRIAKEELSDDTLSHVTLRFPASLIRKYSSDFVILRGEKIDVEGESKKVDNDDAVEDEGEGEEEEEFKWSIVLTEREEGEGDGDLVMDILREEFEAACLPVLEAVGSTVSHTLQQWKALKNRTPVYKENGDTNGARHSPGVGGVGRLGIHDINEVVLVGGSSRSPEVREMVRRALVLEGFSAYSLSSSPSDPSTPPSSSSSSSSSSTQELRHTSSRTRSDGKGSSNAREFCTSVDADHAVAQGLAIRAGILMGVDAGHLKDVLMMDMLPSSIGVLSWDLPLPLPVTTSSSASTSSSSSSATGHGQGGGQGEGLRYFEPVLHRGDSIPSRGVRSFKLAHANQKVVSIDVYEEMEEHEDTHPGVPALPPVVLAAKEVSSAVASSSKRLTVRGVVLPPVPPPVREMKYTYELIGTYDFAIPESVRRAGAQEVDVLFDMSAEGALTFSIREHQDTNSAIEGGVDEEEGSGSTGKRAGGRRGLEGGQTSEESRAMVWVLGGYLTLMLIMYAVVKMVILTPATKELIQSLSAELPTAQEFSLPFSTELPMKEFVLPLFNDLPAAQELIQSHSLSAEVSATGEFNMPLTVEVPDTELI